MVKEVTIIGMGSSAWGAPYDCGPRWGVNGAWAYGTLDRLFFLHTMEKILPGWEESIASGKVHELWTKYPVVFDCPNSDGTCFGKCKNCGNNKLQYFHDGGPRDNPLLKSKVIDTVSIIRECGGIDPTSSIGWVLLQAMLEGYRRVFLFGVEVWECNGTGPYGWQAENINSILRFMAGRGVQTVLPHQIISKIGISRR